MARTRTDPCGFPGLAPDAWCPWAPRPRGLFLFNPKNPRRLPGGVSAPGCTPGCPGWGLWGMAPAGRGFGGAGAAWRCAFRIPDPGWVPRGCRGAGTAGARSLGCTVGWVCPVPGYPGASRSGGFALAGWVPVRPWWGVPGVFAGGVVGVTGSFLGVRGAFGALEGCFGPLRRGFGGGRALICGWARRRVLFSELPG